MLNKTLGQGNRQVQQKTVEHIVLRKFFISLSKYIFPFSQHILLLLALQYRQNSSVYTESFSTTTKAVIFRAKSTMEVEIS